MAEERPVRQATLIVNRAARRVARGFDADRVVRYLRRHGVETRVEEPLSPEAATAVAREAARRGDQLVFAVGGDGTLRDVAEGLAGSTVALAAIPGGTVNIWCKEAGIPHGLKAALDAHIGGQRARVDLGMAGERPFLLMASVGWDAAIAARVSARLKARFGDYAYMAQALRDFRRLRTREASWTSGLAHYTAPLGLMVLSNSRVYGGRVRPSPAARIDDGLLDVAALCPRRRGDGLRLGGRFALSRLHGDRGVTEARVADLAFETPGFAVQADGDPIGETPMRFSVREGALLVSVPAGPLPAIFSVGVG